jgi:hypothetical protein
MDLNELGAEMQARKKELLNGKGPAPARTKSKLASLLTLGG